MRGNKIMNNFLKVYERPTHWLSFDNELYLEKAQLELMFQEPAYTDI